MARNQIKVTTTNVWWQCIGLFAYSTMRRISPLTVEKKKLTQFGVAKFIKESCVDYTDNTECGACSEHCPTKAVDMVPYPNPVKKRRKIPEVKPEYCIGCGGCEHACPTKPYKATYVDGNPLHKLAKKPVVKKI